MSGSEQNTGGSGWAEITSETLGTNNNPSAALSIIDFEISQGAQLATALGVSALLTGAPATAVAAAGLGAAYAVDQIANFAIGVLDNINAELGNQANVMNAINLDGQGFNMPDPVSGTGYW